MKRLSLSIILALSIFTQKLVISDLEEQNESQEKAKWHYVESCNYLSLL